MVSWVLARPGGVLPRHSAAEPARRCPEPTGRHERERPGGQAGSGAGFILSHRVHHLNDILRTALNSTSTVTSSSPSCSSIRTSPLNCDSSSQLRQQSLSSCYSTRIFSSLPSRGAASGSRPMRTLWTFEGVAHLHGDVLSGPPSGMASGAVEVQRASVHWTTRGDIRRCDLRVR